MADSDERLKAFNSAVANRVLRWWEIQSSEPGFDRDTLYIRMDSLPMFQYVSMDPAGKVTGEFKDPRPPIMFVRIKAEHREYGAALVLDVVDTIPASVTRNVSLPGEPIEEHGDLRSGGLGFGEGR